jgi:DNA-binding CsgD family transcriptional regulator
MRAELFGREAELGLLRQRLSGAFQQQPAVVLIRGEPGIGKTTLARALSESAAARGAQVGWGTALEDPDAPPFWIWHQALRSVQARAAAPTAIDALSEVSDRFRQFDAVGTLVRVWCEVAPMLLVLDDAHWMDEPGLLLLNQLIQGLVDERLLIVINVRDGEERHPALLRRAAGSSVTSTIALRGLGRADIGRQLAEQLEREPEPRLVAEVEAATAGNPLFVREMAYAIRDGRLDWRRAVTPTVEAAIGARIERLGSRARQLLSGAAVLGPVFPVKSAAAVGGLSWADALSAADELKAARLLEDGAVPGELRFAHALVQKVIDAGLGGPERVRLHRRAAEEIELAVGEDGTRPVFELARHWREVAAGGEVEPAVRWLELAAEEALRQLAFEDSVRLLRDALRLGDRALEDEHRCRLLLLLAAASHLATDLRGRLQACLDAAALARRLGRVDLLAEAALVLEPGGDPGSSLASRRLAQEALAALDASPSALRARLLARYAETFIYQSVEQEADSASEEAIAIADACQDTEALIAALRTRQVLRSGPAGLAERQELALKMRALGRRSGRRDLELRGLLAAVDAGLERGDLAGVAALEEPLIRCAEELRGPLARFQAISCAAVLAQAQGRLEEARRLAEQAFAVLRPTGHSAAWHLRGGLLTAVAHHGGGSEEVLQVAGMDGAPEEIRQARGLIGRISYAHALEIAGRSDDAAEVYASLGPVAGWRTPPHVELVSAALGLAVAIRLRRAPDAAALAQKLEPHVGHHAVSGLGTVAYYGPVELWLGQARAYLGDVAAAVNLLESAERACAASGAAGFQLESQAELADALLTRGAAGDAARARNLLGPAVRQSRRLGMARLEARLAEIAGRVGEPGARLTPREREVAALVAKGLTNREIAGRLFLSERTAQNHVQHILDKLELANRSQVATWVATQESE